MNRVLITGASGFLGRGLANRLRADGVEVKGVDLATDLERNVVAGDISEPGSWQQAAAGSEVVVHAAAVVTRTPSRELAWRTNVLGTRLALRRRPGRGTALRSPVLGPRVRRSGLSGRSGRAPPGQTR